ncbi:hypothetical protein PRIPAC_82648 [Pristionchus pacificus]|uniref:Uncharacterized protein n=1 Tax=Pristionchus pacificus TaxID=54126 RepID=A0A2A6CAZ1_PRIPA|nr:hypothetical protein PRIPAC_82648 [Pristionchus pacificus]|eukprot:PDM75395.1 hypothetical protein PRIPAC_42572 [Pristionchus pacificus]
MGNQQSSSAPPAPLEDQTAANEPDTDSTCVVSPSQPAESISRKIVKATDVGDYGERKKKNSKPRAKKTATGKSSKQSEKSGRSSKSTSKSSSRGKSRKVSEPVDPIEMELRRAFRGEGREKARFISTVQEAVEAPTIPGSMIKFESMQTVVNVVIPHHRTFKKKNRSKYDPWKRYGALKKLHQIGGWAYNTKDLKKNSSRRSRGAAKSKLKYYEIKKDSKFYLPPPANQPITKLETVLFVLGERIYVVFYEDLKSKFSLAFIRPETLTLKQTSITSDEGLPISMFVKFFVYKKEVYVISPHRNYTLYKAAQRADGGLHFTEVETVGMRPDYDRSLRSPFIRTTDSSTFFCELTDHERQVLYLDQLNLETMRWNRIEFEHNELALIAFLSGSWKGIDGGNGMVYFNFVQTMMGRARGKGPDFVILDCTRKVCHIGVQSHYFPLPAQIFSVEGHIHAFDDRQLYRFEQSNNTWAKIRLPYSDRGAAFYTTVSVIGSRIYLIGGSNGLFASTARRSPSPDFVPVVSVIETVPTLQHRAVACINFFGFPLDVIRRRLPEGLFYLYFRDKSNDEPFPKGFEL